jgi:hypothetical protein
MLRLETWRVTSDDLAALQPYIDQGVLSIVTKEEWLALEPEDEDLLPDLDDLDDLDDLEELEQTFP